MTTQRLNPQLAKSHRSYTVEEIANLYSVHKNTVRIWIKNGLELCDHLRPAIVKGSVLKDYLMQRRASKKRPCQIDEMYCLKCRAPKKPAGGMAEYQAKTSELGSLIAICPDCDKFMYRRTSLGKLRLIQAHLEVTFSKASQHLVDTQRPIVNSDFKYGEES